MIFAKVLNVKMFPIQYLLWRSLCQLCFLHIIYCKSLLSLVVLFHQTYSMNSCSHRDTPLSQLVNSNQFWI